MASGDPLLGVKAATVVFAVGAIVAYVAVLRRLNVVGAFWWTLLAFTTSLFLFRLNLVKALPLSLIWYCFGLVALRERRPWWLVLVSWLYVWTYAGWPLLTATVAVWLAVAVVRARVTFRSAFSLLSAAIVGNVAGLVFNPYVPANVRFYWQQIVQIALTPQITIGVGTEWMPMPLVQFGTSTAPLFILITLAMVVVLVRRPISHQEREAGLDDQSFIVTLGIISVGLFVLTALSRRYVEYFVPITYLTLAVFFSPWLKQFYDGTWPHTLAYSSQRYALVWSLTLACVLSVAAYAGRSISIVDRQLGQGVSLTYLKNVSQWMEQHLPARTLVFNVGWDDFPELFYWNDQQRYVGGLDIRFLASSPTVNRLAAWQDIFQGKDVEIAQIAPEVFQSHYVLVTERNKSAQSLLTKQRLSILYQDAEATLYGIPN